MSSRCILNGRIFFGVFILRRDEKCRNRRAFESILINKQQHRKPSLNFHERKSIKGDEKHKWILPRKHTRESFRSKAFWVWTANKRPRAFLHSDRNLWTHFSPLSENKHQQWHQSSRQNSSDDSPPFTWESIKANAMCNNRDDNRSKELIKIVLKSTKCKSSVGSILDLFSFSTFHWKYFNRIDLRIECWDRVTSAACQT